MGIVRPVIVFRAGGLAEPAVLALLGEHLADMYATSPAESVHALDVEALQQADVDFWSMWEDGGVVGCGALKWLSADDAELKSMRTATQARGRGIGASMLRHLLDEARRRRARRVLLETGPQEFFAPARRLYERHGFVERGPFAGYVEDPHSRFYELTLAPDPATDAHRR